MQDSRKDKTGRRHSTFDIRYDLKTLPWLNTAIGRRLETTDKIDTSEEEIMEKIANLLFEAKMLKEIQRSGYSFLGAGKESVAEHSFCTMMIAYVISQSETDIDALKLISMCLVHDLPEARIGDLNTVHKKYVAADEKLAVEDMARDIFCGSSITELIEEFNAGSSPEAKLASDADQLALVLELKDLADIGYQAPHRWLDNVLERLQTGTGKKIAQSIMATKRDEWWRSDVGE